MIQTVNEFKALLAAVRGKEIEHDLYRYSDEEYKDKKCYDEIFIPKQSGGFRKLNVPNKRLKAVQYEVLRFFEGAELSPHAAAYVKGKGLLDHGTFHVGGKMLVKLDIEDFFPSIPFSQVFHAIDKVLERSPLAGPGVSSKGKNYNSQLSWHFAKICTLYGGLPQGAPTSPTLSNMVFAPLDKIIGAYCEKRGIRYSRYSDDLIFTGDFSPAALIFFVRRLLLENEYRLNEDKIVVAGEGQQKKVTGVVINERPQVSKEYRRQIRQEVYYIGRFGLRDHLVRKGILAEEEGDKDLAIMAKELSRLLGKIDFILQIDKKNREFYQYRRECNLLLVRLPYIMDGMTQMEETDDDRRGFEYSGRIGGRVARRVL